MLDASIIVPTFNRPERLELCLSALASQQGAEFEVIIVDDGSPSPAAPICKRFGPRVRCIWQDNAGPATARNIGAAEARGAVLAFTDDDCKPRPDWLARLLAAQAGGSMRMVGGRVINGLPRNRYAAASQALCDFLYDYFDAAGGTAPFFTSNNFAITREGFAKLGGFDTSFQRAAAEDRDFGIRWREMGGALRYAEDAIVDHYHALSPRSFFRQHQNYGHGARHLHKVMKHRQVDRPRFERLGFYWQLMTWPIRQNGPLRADLSALMVLSQAAMVYGYFIDKERHPN